MDKQTLSHYGWIVIVVLVLAVMLAFATPFGTYVGDAVVATTKGFGSITEHNLNEDNIKNQGDKWEDKFENGVGGGTSEPESPTQPEEPPKEYNKYSLTINVYDGFDDRPTSSGFVYLLYLNDTGDIGFTPKYTRKITNGTATFESIVEGPYIVYVSTPNGSGTHVVNIDKDTTTNVPSWCQPYMSLPYFDESLNKWTSSSITITEQTWELFVNGPYGANVNAYIDGGLIVFPEIPNNTDSHDAPFPFCMQCTPDMSVAQNNPYIIFNQILYYISPEVFQEGSSGYIPDSD